MMVGEQLRRYLRPEDTLARLGGDEFTVLVEDVESPEDAVRVASGRFRGCVSEVRILPGLLTTSSKD